jgi:uncharacterized protein
MCKTWWVNLINMGIRFLLLAVVLWLLFYTIRGYIRRRKDKLKAKPSGRSMDMVACYHCGVHLPQDEAVYEDNQYYCCKEHSELKQKGDQE